MGKLFLASVRYAFKDPERPDRTIVHELSDREGEPFRHRLVIEEFGEDPIIGEAVPFQDIAIVIGSEHGYACSTSYHTSGLPSDLPVRFESLEEVSTKDPDDLIDPEGLGNEMSEDLDSFARENDLSLDDDL